MTEAEPTPFEPDVFQTVIDCLSWDGIAQEAERLDQFLHRTAYTTGSEMLGELGQELKRTWPVVKARGSRESVRAMKAAARRVRVSWRLFSL